jgi:hypothetical protein
LAGTANRAAGYATDDLRVNAQGSKQERQHHQAGHAH